MVSDRADNDFYGLGLLEVEGYTRWDLSAGCRLTEALDIYGTFQNVLDRQYQEALGYPALPFNFRAGVKVRF
jgi:outer membrane receptor protein involved in Fe transport